MQTLTITGCTSKKASTACAASELYDSPLGRGRAMVGRPCRDELGRLNWRILSAKFGLIHPDATVEPYDVALGDLTNNELTLWRRQVAGEVQAFADARGVTLQELDVVVYAGAVYVDALRAAVHAYSGVALNIREPLQGHQIGERLQHFAWVRRERNARPAVYVRPVELVGHDVTQVIAAPDSPPSEMFEIVEDAGSNARMWEVVQDYGTHLEPTMWSTLAEALADAEELRQRAAKVEAPKVDVAPVQACLFGEELDELVSGATWVNISGSACKTARRWRHAPSGFEIHHCGHQTALWPYQLVDPRDPGMCIVSHNGRGFSSLLEAKLLVELVHNGCAVVTCWGCVAGVGRVLMPSELEVEVHELYGLAPRQDDVEAVEDVELDPPAWSRVRWILGRLESRLEAIQDYSCKHRDDGWEVRDGSLVLVDVQLREEARDGLPAGVVVLSFDESNDLLALDIADALRGISELDGIAIHADGGGPLDRDEVVAAMLRRNDAQMEAHIASEMASEMDRSMAEEMRRTSADEDGRGF